MLIPLGDQVIVKASPLSTTLVIPATSKASGSWRGSIVNKSTGISKEGKEVLDKLTIGSVVLVSPRGQMIGLGDDLFLVDLSDVLGVYSDETYAQTN
jgi:co-chaperonin GroES (HSP10)